MAKYVISFPSAAMVVPDDEWEAVGRDAQAVLDEAKAAGVYVFGGGIKEDVPPVLVSADGAVATGGSLVLVMRRGLSNALERSECLSATGEMTG